MGVSVELFSEGIFPLPTIGFIDIKKPEAFGYTLPLRVVGVLSYRYESEYGVGTNAIAELMRRLGGKPGTSKPAIPEIKTDEMLLEVDLRSWVEEVISIDIQIINFTNNLYANDLTMGNFGTITCRRGFQSFTVQLKNGISTPEVTVTSFMDGINALEVSEGYQKSITVPLGKSISNIKIYGNYKDNEGVDQKVDLTPKSFNTNANIGDYHTAAFFRSSPNVCLDMKIEDTSIASLKQYEDISIGGLKEGSTKLIVNLAGSEGELADINLEVLVKVTNDNIRSCPMTRDDGVLNVTIDLADKDKDGNYEDYLECTYYGNGSLHMKSPYRNGKHNGVLKYYYWSGVLEKEYPYKDDKRDGISKEYYESGVMRSETPFKNGILNGISKQFYRSGKNWMIIDSYINGMKNGTVSYYRESGCVYEVEYYENGDWVNTKEFWDCE
jgi:hypothetical protein